MAIDRTDVLGLGAAVLVPLGVGGLGGLATARSIPTWYAGLEKPSWNPPNWLFGPAWTLLYVLMGVASWLVWRQARKGKAVGLALTLYGIQLALNLAWSFIFFGARRPFWAWWRSCRCGASSPPPWSSSTRSPGPLGPCSSPTSCGSPSPPR